MPISMWVFSQEDIGRNSVFQSFLGFSILFSAIGLDQYLLREFYFIKDKVFLYSISWVPGFVIVILFFCVAFFYSDFFVNGLYGLSGISFFLLTFAGVFFNHFLRFSSVLLRLENRAVPYFFSQVLPKLWYVCFLFYLLFFVEQKKFYLLMFGAVSSTFLGAVISWSFIRGFWKIKLCSGSWDLFYSGIKFGFPLLISGFLYWGIGFLPIYFLRDLSGFSELGLYTAASALAAAGIIFQSVFMTSFTPAIYRAVHNGDVEDKHDKLLNFALLLSLFIFLGYGGFAWVVDYLLPNVYGEVVFIFLLAVIAPLFSTISEVASVGINVSKKTYYSMLSSFLAVCLSFVFCSFLVPSYGASGAAIATALAYFFYVVIKVEMAVRVWFSVSRFKVYLFCSVLLMTSVFIAFFKVQYFYIYFWIAFVVFCSLFWEKVRLIYVEARNA